MCIDRPPPLSPLFPYTTLFRSERRSCREVRGQPEEAVQGRERRIGLRRGPVGQVVAAEERRGEPSRPTQDIPPLCLDRKSTRLNSSHGYSSYAVFCLKKKKGLLEGTLQAGTSAVSDKLLDLVGLGGKSAADNGKDTRDYLAAAFPDLNALYRAGADASSAGMVDAGCGNQKGFTKMQVDNQKEIDEMQNETQKEIA